MANIPAEQGNGGGEAHFMSNLQRSRGRMISRWQRRQRRGDTFRQLFTRMIANLSLGFLLVGCACPHSLSQFGCMQANIRDPDSMTRLKAYQELREEKLAEKDRATACHLLMEASAHETYSLARAEAVSSLGSYRGPEVRRALLLAMEDSSPMVRQAAIFSLTGLLDRSVVERIGKLVATENDMEVRRAAVVVLGSVGDSTGKEIALPALANLTKDRDFTVARAAAGALEKRTGQKFGTDYAAWEKFLHLRQPGQSLFASESRPGFNPVAN